MNNRGMNGNEEEADWSAFKKFWAEEFGGGLQALTMARTSWIAGQKYLHEQNCKKAGTTVLAAFCADHAWIGVNDNGKKWSQCYLCGARKDRSDDLPLEGEES